MCDAQRADCQQNSVVCVKVNWDVQLGMIRRVILWQTIFVNKIRMLQRTRRNTIGRRSTHVHDVLGLPSLIRVSVIIFVMFVRFSCHFSSVICTFSSENIF